MSKTPAELIADLGDVFPDNTAGEITPEVLRDQQTDVVEAIADRALVVDADGDETTVRPAGALVVMWINSPVEPVNADPGDLWFEAD